MIIDVVAERILRGVSRYDIEVIDYAVGLHYVYVFLRIGEQRSLGVAHSYVEEYQHGYWVRDLEPEMIPEMVSSPRIMDKNLAVAYLNALSQFLIEENRLPLQYDVNAVDAAGIKPDDVVVVVGNIKPTVERARKYTDKVYVLERTPSARDDAYPDTAAPRIIPMATVLLITGATLVNDTLDYILELGRNAREKILVGGTAQIYPPYIIGHGVTRVASMKIMDTEKAMRYIRAGCGTRPLLKLSRKYIYSPR